MESAKMSCFCSEHWGTVWGNRSWMDLCFEGFYFYDASLPWLRANIEQHGQSRSLTWPETLTGVLSTVLLSAGVLRHYYDIYVHRTVRGISFLFVGIDAAGDVFSLISVCLFPFSYPSPITCLTREFRELANVD